MKGRLARIRREGLERRTRPLPPGVLSFCSNDTLGLARHPDVVRAARRALVRWGWGSTGSRLVTGTTRAHLELERDLAAFHRRPAALLFGTGYQANLGMITALVSREDLLLSDRLNHASLIDGCRLSRAEIRVYRHADLTHLEDLLKRGRRRGRRVWILTDAVFSVDGDLAPLGGIAALAERYGAGTLVDEAHAIGIFGAGGSGLVSALDLSGRIDAVVGTLSKALGGFGGWVSGSPELAAILRSVSRPFLFTTAPPAAAAAAARAALRISASAEGEARRARLWGLAGRLRAGLGLPAGGSPITALRFKGVATAGLLSDVLLRRGFFVHPLRPPTVAPGTSCLRISPSAAHTGRQVDRLLDVLRTASP